MKQEVEHPEAAVGEERTAREPKARPQDFSKT